LHLKSLLGQDKLKDKESESWTAKVFDREFVVKTVKKINKTNTRIGRQSRQWEPWVDFTNFCSPSEKTLELEVFGKKIAVQFNQQILSHSLFAVCPIWAPQKSFSLCVCRKAVQKCWWNRSLESNSPSSCRQVQIHQRT